MLNQPWDSYSLLGYVLQSFNMQLNLVVSIILRILVNNIHRDTGLFFLTVPFSDFGIGIMLASECLLSFVKEFEKDQLLEGCKYLVEFTKESFHSGLFYFCFKFQIPDRSCHLKTFSQFLFLHYSPG